MHQTVACDEVCHNRFAAFDAHQVDAVRLFHVSAETSRNRQKANDPQQLRGSA